MSEPIDRPDEKIAMRCSTCAATADYFGDGHWRCPNEPEAHKGKLKWSARISVTTVKDGKRVRQRKRRTFNSYRDAKRWVLEEEDAKDKGRAVAPNHMTLADFLEGTDDTLGWFARLETESLPQTNRPRRLSTISNYKHLLGAYVMPLVGHRRLRDLNREIIEKTYAEILSSGKRDGSGVSNNTMRRVASVLSLALSDAASRNLIPHNPAQYAKVPGNSETYTDSTADELEVWTEDQLQEFWRYIGTEHDLYPVLYTLAWTGLRLGELCGLQWPKVDLGAKRLRVDWQRTAPDWKVIEGPPKTRAGIRWVPFVNTDLADVLADWRRRQRDHAEEHGLTLLPNGYVFTDPFGEPLHPKRLGKEIVGFIENSPFTPKLTAHGFRDTYATLVLARGVEDWKVSRILGHSNPRVTHERYNRWIPSYDDSLTGLANRDQTGTYRG